MEKTFINIKSVEELDKISSADFNNIYVIDIDNDIDSIIYITTANTYKIVGKTHAEFNCEDAVVYAYDSSYIITDGCNVKAFDNAEIAFTSYDESIICEAFNNAVVYVIDCGKVIAHDTSRVTANYGGIIEAFDNSYVYIGPGSSALLHDDAVIDFDEEGGYYKPSYRRV